MTKPYTMAELAEALDGKLIGDGSVKIARLAHPSEARHEGDLALAMDKNFLPLLSEHKVRAAVIADETAVDPKSFRSLIVVKRARLAMAVLTNLFAQVVSVPKGVHPSAIVEKGAKLGKDVAIGPMVYVSAGAEIGARCVLHPHVYIGPDAVIGEDVVIHSGVKVGARVKIGARCLIHFNASIGADGFSFVTPETGSVEAAKATGVINATNQTLVRIASLGAVEIGDDVEIGANTSIDRGTVASTRIGNGTKIDNQVQIGHNVVIGENCMICGRTGIAGSVTIGDRVVLGGAVGVADHVKIGDDAIAMGMSGIASNVAPKTIVGGAPAKPRDKAMEEHLFLGRSKTWVKKVESLAERLDALERQGKTD
jgi:UDP-3-O-[3-hydroxymyristoyl] glucosamine N-acyltransferase